MDTFPELKILLIDDFAEDRTRFEYILKNYPEYNFNIMQCDNGASGLTHIRQHSFDCVVLDHNMPGQTGLSVLKELRIKDIHVPVVMLTGSGDERVAVEALKSGAQEYLPKSDAHYRKLPNMILSAIDRKKRDMDFLAMVNTDSLTGLTSRHCFLENLDKSIARSERSNQALALMFIDVDKFKDINDTYGHNIGDCVLKELSKRLTTCLRGSDTLARLGGDEFVILLENINDSDLTCTSAVANRVITAINSNPFICEGDKQIPVDISLGIALYPKMAKDKSELLELADKAMYNSKKSDCSHVSFAQNTDAAA